MLNQVSNSNHYIKQYQNIEKVNPGSTFEPESVFFDPVSGGVNYGGGNEVGVISEKMRLGNELSPSEMDYLKAKAPDLYSKAVALEHERKAFLEKLKKCKSKEEVMQLKNGQVNQILGSRTPAQGGLAVEQNDWTLMRMNSIDKAFCKYIGTGDFKKLPDFVKEQMRGQDRIDFAKLEEGNPASMFKNKLVAQGIASRIAAGENVQGADLAFLEKHEPIMAMEARHSNEGRKRLQVQVKNQLNKEDRREMIKQARLAAICLQPSDTMIQLSLSAIDQVEKDMWRN